MLIGNYPYLDKSILDYIDFYTKDRTDFDERMFSDWIAKSEVNNKNNPSGYIKSCFRKELEKGTFKPQPIKKFNETELLAMIMPTLYKYLPMFDCDLANAFGDETFFVENLQIYIYKHNILTIDELNDLNDKVMSYIVALDEPKLTDYREYIKKAQLLKGKVNWTEIEKIEARERKEFDDLMKWVEERENDLND